MQPITEVDLKADAWDLFNTSHDQFMQLQERYLPVAEPTALRKLVQQLDQDIYKCYGRTYDEDSQVLENRLIDVAIRAFAGVLVLRGHGRAA